MLRSLIVFFSFPFKDDHFSISSSRFDEVLYGQLVELIADFMENYRNRIQKLEAKKHEEKEEKH